MLSILPMMENVTLKPSHYPSTIIKQHPWRDISKSLPLYGKYSKSDQTSYGRFNDSIRTYADDSSANIKYGGEKDSSKVQKRRRPRHKRRKKRRGRREKGKRRRSTTIKRRLRKKKKSQNCYRLNSQLGLQHAQKERNVQQCVVSASSVLQTRQYLSFEQCQVLVHIRTWDARVIFRRRWLYYKPFSIPYLPVTSCRPVKISKTSQTCNAAIIAHGRLLLVPLARPYFNLSFIVNNGFGASISTSCGKSQLHDGVVHNTN